MPKTGSSMNQMAKPVVPFICEGCGTPFDPEKGGRCACCGRVMCAQCLGGRLRMRVLVMRGHKPLCEKCRKEAIAENGKA
ncbi:MAG: hypothetical protein FJ272_19240 [Planctomycetes bacterium]|nr:hypothetical protein [Planctomycetota bacterium]MBM4086929.1 hypothetical protein [Planctomycetota bacterium]